MPYTEPTSLAIVACPGGEAFANEVITHLKHMYKHRFTLKNDVLSKRYDLSKEELVKRINLRNDLQTSDLCIRGATDKYRPPVFKVNARFTYFANGEVKTELLESVRGKDVYIFQDVENHEVLSLNGGANKVKMTVNDHVMSLLVTIDAVRIAGAASITLDIHSREIVNAFSTCNVDNLHASYQIIRELSKIVDLSGKTEDMVIVSPDTGAIDRNKFYASGLKLPLAMIYKERDYSIVTQDAHSTNIRSVKLLGDVKGKVAFLADDMIGTGGTLLKAMGFLKEQGATKVICAASLPFFTGNAIEQFDEAYKQGLFYRIIGTNAVYHEELLNREWYINTDVSGLFANVITRIHYNQSLSELLDNRNIIEKVVKQNNYAAEKENKEKKDQNK